MQCLVEASAVCAEQVLAKTVAGLESPAPRVTLASMRPPFTRCAVLLVGVHCR